MDALTSALTQLKSEIELNQENLRMTISCSVYIADDQV